MPMVLLKCDTPIPEREKHIYLKVDGEDSATFFLSRMRKPYRARSPSAVALFAAPSSSSAAFSKTPFR